MYQEKYTKNAILLFVGIVFILFLWNPNILIKLYNNIYGKIIIILLLIMFSVHTIYFGLALLVIILLVIQWEPLSTKEGMKENMKESIKNKNENDSFTQRININPLIDEFKPMNSKEFNIPKTNSSHVEPFIFSSLIKNSHSLFI
jgi:hypothetical protein